MPQDPFAAYVVQDADPFAAFAASTPPPAAATAGMPAPSLPTDQPREEKSPLTTGLIGDLRRDPMGTSLSAAGILASSAVPGVLGMGMRAASPAIKAGAQALATPGGMAALGAAEEGIRSGGNWKRMLAGGLTGYGGGKLSGRIAKK